MARTIIGTLDVPSYVATGNPGEYTFTNAVYNCQTDETGSGAFDLAAGFLMYIQATDIYTAMPIPGLAHRYKLTSVTTSDGVHVDGTILWDEGGTEADSPTSSTTCIVTEPSSLKKYGFFVSEMVYSALSTGVPQSGYNTDVKVITDKTTFVEYHTITSSEATDKKFLLENSPFVADRVIADVEGGPAQTYGVDFTIVNDEFRWNGLGLDGILGPGDVVRLRYT